MAKFKIVERKIIQMGMQEISYEIEADTAEQAEALVEQNDADDFCTDIDYSIEQSELLETLTEEM